MLAWSHLTRGHWMNERPLVGFAGVHFDLQKGGAVFAFLQFPAPYQNSPRANPASYSYPNPVLDLPQSGD